MAPNLVEENVWLGARLTILSGMHAGRDSIMGPGAVLSKDVATGDTLSDLRCDGLVPPMLDILKAGLKVGVATLAGLLGWVVAGKILALTLGAAGVGLFGLLRQLLQNLTLMGSLNGQQALVQGIASRTTRSAQLRFAGSVFHIQVILGGTLAAGLLVFAPWLGPWLIPDSRSVALVRWLTLALAVTVAQAYWIGLLNGHRLINSLVKSQMLGPVAVLLLVFPMVWLVRRGYPTGFVLMLGGPAAVITFAAAWSARQAAWMPTMWVWKIDRSDALGFFRMSAVLLVTGVVTTSAQFFESWLVARRMGLAQAGQFWTAWAISMSYVTLVLGSLGSYYMPSLTCLADADARRRLIRSYLGLSLIAMPVIASLVIVIKPWIIRGMFSPALLPALKVMRWMLIGDFFKGLAWVLAFPMLALNDMKWFFFSEVGFSVGMAGAAWLWLSLRGSIEGLGLIFMLLYVLYLLVMIIYIRVRHGFAWRAVESGQFMVGLALVILLSVLTWRDNQVKWLPFGLFTLLGGAYLLISVGISGRHGLRWFGKAPAGKPLHGANP
jgi:PST family polysaccharide transporter